MPIQKSKESDKDWIELGKIDYWKGNRYLPVTFKLPTNPSGNIVIKCYDEKYDYYIFSKVFKGWRIDEAMQYILDLFNKHKHQNYIEDRMLMAHVAVWKLGQEEGL